MDKFIDFLSNDVGPQLLLSLAAYSMMDSFIMDILHPIFITIFPFVDELEKVKIEIGEGNTMSIGKFGKKFLQYIIIVLFSYYIFKHRANKK